MVHPWTRAAGHAGSCSPPSQAPPLDDDTSRPAPGASGRTSAPRHRHVAGMVSTAARHRPRRRPRGLRLHSPGAELVPPGPQTAAADAAARPPGPVLGLPAGARGAWPAHRPRPPSSAAFGHALPAPPPCGCILRTTDYSAFSKVLKADWVLER